MVVGRPLIQTLKGKTLLHSNNVSISKATHIIKMAKVWKYCCNVPIRSLAIELISVCFTNLWLNKDKSSVYYDWMVKDFFTYLSARKNSYEAIPGITEICYFGGDWESKALSAFEHAKKACEYEAAHGDQGVYDILASH